MNCPKCGAPIAPGSAFCAACGTSVTDPGAATVIVATAEETDQLLAQLRRELAKDYEVEKELGRGGMAVVYKAREIELRRLVALKVLPPGMGSGDMAERFRREARMAAALDHPNIIPIHRVGQAAGTYFFAMKFVEGRAVDAIIEQQGALPTPVALQILRSAASALAFAHERQIVHRDIKGANIMVDRDGRVLVADFGIARAAEEKTLTASGAVIGTPHFMSPEQCSGQKVGPQSDQYSLGVLAFQMLTGQVPFDADSVITIIQHHYFTPVPDIRAVREGVPEELLAVVYRALAKDPGQRYAATREMANALEAVPCAAEEKAQAEETLRQLARGEAIARIRTASLPPLADARTMGAAALSALSATIAGGGPVAPAAATAVAPKTAAPKARRRKPWLPAGAVIVLVAGAVGVYFALRGGATSPSRETAPPGTGPQVAAGGAVTQPTQGMPQVQPTADTTKEARAAPSPGMGARTRADTSPSPAPAGARAPARKAQAPPRAVEQAAQAPADSGLIRVLTQPPTAQISVDGKKIGEGSAFDVKIAAGRRRLRITAPGCAAYDTTITVEPDATLRLRTITLQCESAP